MTVPILDLAPQHEPLLPQFMGAFENALRSGQFVLGQKVDVFEQALATYCHVEHAIGVSSGTDALLLALMALEIGSGDEVITSPFTFFATASVVARLGARPVFVDIDPATFNLDPSLLEAAITPNTRAVIPVHLYGLMADMTAINHIADRHGLSVIEDAAQAIGATDHDRSAGSIANVGCLSFYPTKNLSALGDAGACLTNDAQLAKLMRQLRVHGQADRYHHHWLGGNFRIDALQATWLNVKLPLLDSWNEQRRVIAHRYSQGLVGWPIDCPVEPVEKKHVYHQYTVRVRDGRRDALRDDLHNRGIGCEVYYPVPLHLQKPFAYLNGRVGDFPHVERATAEVLSLPIYPGLSKDRQDEVIDAIRDFFQGKTSE